VWQVIFTEQQPGSRRIHAEEVGVNANSSVELNASVVK
jgi:hypothetical protein